MDVRRLTHFIALAEEGRFAAAADRVHLSQAAFSRSIQTLEERLGVRLVDRRSEGVSLTPTGNAVLARARTLVFDSDCLVRDVALLKSR
ncbi:MAG: LysR family transcriptional regulator, partial [Ramlibacter sp.]